MAGPQIHQEGPGGWAEWPELCGQISGNASISFDMMRAVMDESYALFGN